MRALVDHGFLHSGQTVEDDGSCPAFDVVDGGLNDGSADCGGHDPAEERGRYSSHGGCVGSEMVWLAVGE